MAFRLKGAYPKEAKDSSQYTLIIQEGHMQVNQGGAEANRTDVGPFQIEE
jgi:hypothetical protein